MYNHPNSLLFIIEIYCISSYRNIHFIKVIGDHHHMALKIEMITHIQLPQTIMMTMRFSMGLEVVVPNQTTGKKSLKL